jgi:glycosyltransferase involved in cell wall biosynthesis
MSACIFFHPEAYSTAGPRLMGRNAAGESFLRGFLAHTQANEFWAQVLTANDGKPFAEAVASARPGAPVRIVDKHALPALAQAGTVYHPGPGLGEHAWQRAAFGHAAWSLCGITHTTASARAMDAIVELLSAPVQPWDALICTSQAVKANVTVMLQAQAEHLRERLGASRFVLPQVPVIPLGIHADDFAYTPQQRADARRALGVEPDTLVVLFVGRLSFHAKAHPLAMYQALERAAARTGRKVLLVECGWHANDFIVKAYAAAAALACPSVSVRTLDGRVSADRLTAWAGADVFCSLSDNVQETFGIVPIEAMAAGLPVVVSDWDGYRDTVRDGVDGFRVPTLMPAGGLGGDLAVRHAVEQDTYDMYCGHTCTLVAVDVEATTEAFARLFASAELRGRMAEAGRQRAREVYDWAAIIPQYEALWVQLAEIRRAQPAGPGGAPGAGNLRHPWPARADPFDLFAAYPTRPMAETMMLGLVDADASAAWTRLAAMRALAMVDFAKYVLPDESELRAVLEAAAAGPRAARDLVSAIAPARQAFVYRALVWLVKLGVLRVA